MTWIEQMEFAASVGPAWVTILFIGLFLGTLVWICRPGSDRHYDRQAHLPLEDGAPRSPHSSASENRNG
jgi:cbb3-type cytochrome oxidase subunit 3